MCGELAWRICQALVSCAQTTHCSRVGIKILYLCYRDGLVTKGRASELSAAVVFLPEHTLEYGEHGSDKCFCEDMYGTVHAACGCKWFEAWRQHIEKAVALKQRLYVFYAEGRVGQGQYLLFHSSNTNISSGRCRQDRWVGGMQG